MKSPDHKAWNEWVEKVLKPALAKMPERPASDRTGSGLDSTRLAIPEEITADYLEKLGFPGQFPFTRGVQPSGYRGKFWTMRQYAGFSSASESNQRYRQLLKRGTTGLSVAFDLPTQLGYDSDDPVSQGEVGKVGVAIDSLKDMEILFDQIPLDQISTSMTINAPAAVLLAMYAAVAEKQGVPLNQLKGTIQNDILKEYIARGTYIFPPRPGLRLITDTFEWCAREVPGFNPISISGYHIREAGSTAVQEVAFTLADAIVYIQSALDRGLKLDDFAPRLSFFFDADSDLFEEAAKFRAARRLYARIIRDRFHSNNPRNQMLRFHTQTAGYTLQAQQPEINVVRVTIQALAAVLGGTQSLHTNASDEAISLPTEKAAAVALRTQQILAHESGVCNTVDPLGGSYYVEQLTDAIEQQAFVLIQQIDAMGGMIVAIEKGFVQGQIEESSYRYQNQIESRERVIVGVNQYVEEGEAPEAFRVDESTRRTQTESLRALKKQRDQKAVQQCLQDLESTARGSGNLMPDIFKAVKAYATIGEICGVLRKVFGIHQDVLSHH